MHNVNANVEIFRHDALSPTPTASQAAITTANSTRRPLVLLNGGASARFPGGSHDEFVAPGDRSGPVAGWISMIKAAIMRVRMKRQARKEARVRRMARDEMGYLSNHILRDIGLSHGQTDIALHNASLHGPRL